MDIVHRRHEGRSESDLLRTVRLRDYLRDLDIIESAKKKTISRIL